MPSTLLILYGMDFPTICFSAAAAFKCVFLEACKIYTEPIRAELFYGFYDWISLAAAAEISKHFGVCEPLLVW